MWENIKIEAKFVLFVSIFLHIMMEENCEKVNLVEVASMSTEIAALSATVITHTPWWVFIVQHAEHTRLKSLEAIYKKHKN